MSILLREVLGHLQPAFDQLDIRLRRGDAFGRFLLEAVKHVDGVAKPDGINSSVGVAFQVLDHLQHASRALALQRFSSFVLLAGLRQMQRVTELVLNLVRHGQQIPPAARDPYQRLDRWAAGHSALIPKWVSEGEDFAKPFCLSPEVKLKADDAGYGIDILFPEATCARRSGRRLLAVVICSAVAFAVRVQPAVGKRSRIAVRFVGYVGDERFGPILGFSLARFIGRHRGIAGRAVLADDMRVGRPLVDFSVRRGL